MSACQDPGPGDAHCTEEWDHQYSCYDAGDDVSFNDRQDWIHEHPGCPSDGLANVGSRVK